MLLHVLGWEVLEEKHVWLYSTFSLYSTQFVFRSVQKPYLVQPGLKRYGTCLATNCKGKSYVM